jgi:hypothetical protein
LASLTSHPYPQLSKTTVRSVAEQLNLLFGYDFSHPGNKALLKKLVHSIVAERGPAKEADEEEGNDRDRRPKLPPKKAQRLEAKKPEPAKKQRREEEEEEEEEESGDEDDESEEDQDDSDDDAKARSKKKSGAAAGSGGGGVRRSRPSAVAVPPPGAASSSRKRRAPEGSSRCVCLWCARVALIMLPLSGHEELLLSAALEKVIHIKFASRVDVR